MASNQVSVSGQGANYPEWVYRAWLRMMSQDRTSVRRQLDN